jgi:hypothetical protein
MKREAALATGGRYDQAHQIALAIVDPERKAAALHDLADRLAQAHEYSRLLTVTQQTWRAATTRDEALRLLPLANGLIVLKPELAGAIRDSFVWVKTFLE